MPMVVNALFMYMTKQNALGKQELGVFIVLQLITDALNCTQNFKYRHFFGIQKILGCDFFGYI